MLSNEALTAGTAVLRDKLNRMREAGLDAYPAEAFPISMPIRDALQAFDDLAETRAALTFAGRITGLRKMGRATFADLIHDGERLQLYVLPANLDPAGAQAFTFVERGDFVGVAGKLFRTQRGEKTLEVTSVTVLGKPLEVPPIGKRDTTGTYYQGLGDQGRIVRERHVALMVDPVFRTNIILRSRIIREIRRYLEGQGFIEVETPVLSDAYGGASATPFTAYCVALKKDMYLRVSPEPHLKRVLCGDLPKIFEVARNFRNEGIDRTHNPEFTSVEWYQAFSDYHAHMEHFEKMVSGIVLSLTGSYWLHREDQIYDFSPPWPRLSVLNGVATAMDLAPSAVTFEALGDFWVRSEIRGIIPSSWGERLMGVFEKLVEPNLTGPVFVIDHPVEISPLTKTHRRDSRLVERFEPYVAGIEIGNAYSELNDPIEQRRRLSSQDMTREETYGLDEDFLRAIDHGMPQAGGAGMGIDRLVMLLTSARRLSEVMLFPAVK